MTQHELKNRELMLKVKPSPLFIRAIMFLFTFLFFLLPISGMILSLSMGNGFHIGFLFGMGFFGVMGFYLLRMTLWNTYGVEIITFENSKVTYEANYGWFKDGKKTKEMNPIVFSIKPIGYEEENKGVLIIGTDDLTIECTTKMSIDEISLLITKLNSGSTQVK